MLSSESFKKKWTYWWIDSPQVLISLAVVNLGYAGTAFITVVDRSSAPGSAPLFHHSWFTLPRLGVSVRESLEAPLYAGFTAPGVLIEISQGRAQSPAHLTLETSEIQLGVELDLQSGASPHRVDSHLYGDEKKGAIVTQKQTQIPVRGSLRLGSPGAPPFFNLEGSLAGCDWTFGHVPRHTRWHWAFATTGKTGTGETIAWNLCQGNNLGGKTENVVWIDGEKTELPRIQMQRVTPEVRGPYRLWSEKEEVDLRFDPLTSQQQNLNAGLVRSRFLQQIGFFSGSIRVGEKKYDVEKIAGVLENQDSHW